MEILERESAFAALNEATREAVEEGNGRIVLVSGEAGIGKTTLVDQFIAAQDKRVLWGVCDALFTPRPLGPLYDMAAQVGGEIRELLQDQPDRPAIFAACLNECHTPTILVFEDVHWADEATLDLLKYLGRRIHMTRSLLVATFRDDALGARHPLRLLLGDLARSVGVQRIKLLPLSETAVRQLAGEQPIDVKSLHQQTGGNPFFVTEVLAAGGGGIPDTVRDAVLARAARLSLSGQAVLNAAAVIGQRIEPWLLQEVVQAEATAVEESLQVGVLLAQGNYYAFRHELARQAILDEILPHQRTFLHQTVLDALKVSPAGQNDAARLAHHAAGANNSEAILTFARQAGQEAVQMGMHRAATTWFELVLPHAEALPIQEQIALYETYALHNQSQDLAKSFGAFQRVVELAQATNQPVLHGLALVRMAVVHYRLGELTACDQLLQEALVILEPLAPNRALVSAYPLVAMRHLFQGEAETAVTFAEKGHQMAVELENIEGILQAYQVVGLCTMPLDHAQGLYHLQQCLELALANNHFRMAGTIYSNLIMHQLDTLQTSKVEQWVQTAKPYLVEHDLDFNLNMTRAWEAMLRFYQGRWAECETLSAEVLQASPAPIARIPALVAQGRLCARRGEAKKVNELLAESYTLSKKLDNQQRIGVYYCAAVEAAWLAGDKATVHELLVAFYETAVKNKLPGFAAEMAYWQWRIGESVETFSWMVEPFVLEIDGDWQTAAAAWEALGCPYEQARALASGDVEAQKAALLIFERLGAKPMIERVQQQLKTAGVQAIPRGPRATTQENPFQLTNRQLEILTLLTESLTNAEIAARLHISPKTVDHHVSAVLGKLQVSSREEAAGIARQHPNL
ncbi:ATP-binding protein [Candidatus Leptofilum sp.]|uniref:ATP-binding protein n=1 Tax=Candidatus Leptofilum sp. TaxID=3241576 RepID=UPI003B58C77D